MAAHGWFELGEQLDSVERWLSVELVRGRDLLRSRSEPAHEPAHQGCHGSDCSAAGSWHPIVVGRVWSAETTFTGWAFGSLKPALAAFLPAKYPN